MPPLSSVDLPYGVHEQLRAAGFYSVEDVVGQDELVLAQRAHMPLEDVRQLQRALRMNFAAAPVPAALLLHQARIRHHPLSVGFPSMNELLGGGLWAGEVTELVGGAASGKTALCLQACASVLADSSSTIAYIDSANAFTPARLLPLLPHADMTDAMSALARLRCWRIHDGQTLLTLLHELLDGLADGNSQESDFAQNLRLIVVDSVASLLSPLLSSASLGHAVVSGVSRALRLLAARHNLVVLVTNYVVGGDDESAKSVKPALGEAWGMTSSTRIYLSRQVHRASSPPLYSAALLKSSQEACTGHRVWFGIDGQGLTTLEGSDVHRRHEEDDDERHHHHHDRMQEEGTHRHM